MLHTFSIYTKCMQNAEATGARDQLAPLRILAIVMILLKILILGDNVVDVDRQR